MLSRIIPSEMKKRGFSGLISEPPWVFRSKGNSRVLFNLLVRKKNVTKRDSGISHSYGTREVESILLGNAMNRFKESRTR